MDGNSTDDNGIGGMPSPKEGISAGQRCQSVDSLAEWRSSEHLPPHLLYGTRMMMMTVGPNPPSCMGNLLGRLKIFHRLTSVNCEAMHLKLVFTSGWSHFAQFTIAVVHKDPKKSKFSDTLHRFWKKEHDWGWKKFMELTKVLDGFIDNDTLVIKAQVQVIREKAHRPFRCLDCQYRRELVRIYLSNVEQICRRFIEDRKNKLGKLIEDKMRWSSFYGFWLGVDQNLKRLLSRDKSETILRAVVKHFFVEKEVTSTLVMDSLHSGLRALEYQSKNKNGGLMAEMEESPAPMIRVDKDMFVLADDVFLLLERVASEPLPTMSLPPKDEKVSQNRTKEGSSGEEFNKDAIERDERRLTELGRRTVENFVLSHIFSRIEIAFQEAVALKRQDELIREEEAAWQAENELKAKRAIAEKEKRAKKKQAKQKRNNRRSKEKQRDLKAVLVSNEKEQEEHTLGEVSSLDLSGKQEHVMNGRVDSAEDASDVSNIGDDVTESLDPDLQDRDATPLNWDTDTSEVHPSLEATASELSIDQPEKTSHAMDDTSSTCSTDSVPSVISNGSYKVNSVVVKKCQTFPNRLKCHGSKIFENQSVVVRHTSDICHNCTSTRLEPDADAIYLKHTSQYPDAHQEDVVVTIQKKTIKNQCVAVKQSNTRTVESSCSAPSPPGKMQHLLQQTKQSSQSNTTASNMASSITVPVPIKEPSQSSPTVPRRSTASQQSSTSISEANKLSAAKNLASQPMSTISRPSSAPLIPAAAKTSAPVISTVQLMPLLSRSVSAAGRLATDSSPLPPSYFPQSYRNAIVGKTSISSNIPAVTHTASSSSSQASTSSQSTASTSSCLLPPSATRNELHMASRPDLTFGSVKPAALHIEQHQRYDSMHHTSSSISTTTSSTGRLDVYNDKQVASHQRELFSSAPFFPSHGAVSEEFPHLDIINDLLNEEYSIMGRADVISGQHRPQHQRHHFSRQYSLPTGMASINLGSNRYDNVEQYYENGFHNMFGSSSGRALHRLQDGHFSQVDLSAAAYANGQVDGMVHGQWPYGHVDVPILNLGSPDAGGFSYQHLSDYAMGNGMNGYGIYQP
ncbi:hypothetical protein HPP92_010070 [Vanilla planifolia]|uniref:MATH domain-containing protein n=1 Tax=Vanilla planifolia TaxID=51239 RepID=A0A835QY86_VANPL|nr:hypothetical protein HPP92_010070 [Vanilla planifolia]